MLPILTPVTMPVTDPTVAIAVLPLLQVPPAVASDSVTDAPDGNVVLPVTGNMLFTVTVAKTLQPPTVVYVIFAVPAPTPVTTPLPEPTVATPVLPLVHAPPPASLSVMVRPAHTGVFPVMAAGVGLTVITVVVIQPELTL